MMLRLSVLLCILEAVAGLKVKFGMNSYSIFPPSGGNDDCLFPVMPLPCRTKYFLLTRKNLDQPEEICIGDHNGISSLYFNPNKSTYIVIHGGWHSAEEPWMKDVCRAILEVGDDNCILMDWSSCTWDLLLRMVQNVQTLGADLHRFVCLVQEKYNYDPEKITLIGNNIGGHIAGQAGRRTKWIGRIIALNPNRPVLQGEEWLHLTKNDAKFVHIIHTDAGVNGYGSKEPTGHMDCYVNGGEQMPECPPPLWPLVEVACLFSSLFGPVSCGDTGSPTRAYCAELLQDKEVTLNDILDINYSNYCSHYQAINYLISSIRRPEDYLAWPCATVEDCMKGVTTPCPDDQCPHMGYLAEPPVPDTGESLLYCLTATALPVLPYW